MRFNSQLNPERHVTLKRHMRLRSRQGRSMTPILNLFTGIVQGKARVRSIDTKNASSSDALSLRTFQIQFPQESTDIETVKVGASIALNGTCLTVTSTSVDDSVATFDVIEETLKRTNLGSLEENSSVNFERSARVGDEIGGHTVSGHVQTTAMVTKVTTADDGTVKMDFELRDPSWMKYILSKGFVAAIVDTVERVVARYMVEDAASQ
ncbi:Riboflavin synthase [Picochlorum sp. SENEW3]|nr:Riboflavin synthase [Picochlorum sp. SENEW3]WPT15880.1 Riboflavin synthase [Picochlorum sp. SENEW3]